jgi:hypothetical protein
MLCGNGSDRTQHPCELWGDDWQAWGSDFLESETRAATDAGSGAVQGVALT